MNGLIMGDDDNCGGHFSWCSTLRWQERKIRQTTHSARSLLPIKRDTLWRKCSVFHQRSFARLARSQWSQQWWLESWCNYMALAAATIIINIKWWMISPTGQAQQCLTRWLIGERSVYLILALLYSLKWQPQLHWNESAFAICIFTASGVTLTDHLTPAGQPAV